MSARVVIVNAVALNAGDAAILLGEIAALREAYGPDLEVQVCGAQPEVAGRLYPGLSFLPGLHADDGPTPRTAAARLARSLRRRRRSLGVRLLARVPGAARRLLDDATLEHLEVLRGADVVVATGGTYLVEHYPLDRHADELRAALALGRPLVLYTQSLGPFRRPGTRRRMAGVLRRARRIFLRDERSRRHLLELGVPAALLEVRPDAAFTLARERSAAGPPAGAAPAGRLRVAVSVRRWQRFGDRPAARGLAAYRGAVADTVRRLVAGGAEVVFLSTCQGVPEYWTDDSRFARDLVDELLPGVAGVRVDGRFRPPPELLGELRGFDLVIATRMHLAILALCAEVPTVPIAYEFKTTELFGALGLGELVEEIGSVTAEGLWSRVSDALRRHDEIRARVAAALPELRRDASAPARWIREHHPPRPVPEGVR